MSFHFSRRKFIDGGGVLAASSFLSPPRLRFGSVHVGAPMKPEELRAKLRGGLRSRCAYRKSYSAVFTREDF
jgi:hypothetical protein